MSTQDKSSEKLKEEQRKRRFVKPSIKNKLKINNLMKQF
jgi:hypothetical protein